VIDDPAPREALRAVLGSTPHLEAAVLLRADQATVTAAAISRICGVFAKNPAPIVAASCEHQAGLPALFARSLFPELLSLDRESDVKRLIAEHAAQVLTVSLPVESAEDQEVLRGR
jgi:molybdenum cofactor cytidylyltransferase